MRTCLLYIFLALTLASAVMHGAETSANPSLEPALADWGTSADDYAVFFKANTDSRAKFQQLVDKHGGTLNTLYERPGRCGFTARIPPAAIEELRADPDIEQIIPAAKFSLPSHP